MIDPSKVEVQPADQSVDVATLLEDSMEGIFTLEQLGMAIPREVHELCGVFRRCIVAERELELLRHSTFH